MSGGPHHGAGGRSGEHGRAPLLVGDVGGTNVRVALAGDGRLAERASLEGADGTALEAALESWLDELGDGRRPAAGVLAVAAPVLGDRVSLTNRDWEFSVAALRERLRLPGLRVVNDLAAIAAGAVGSPEVGAADGEGFEEIQPGTAEPGTPRAFLGVGTGLGVSLAVPCAGRWHVVPTEGGHRDLAASSPAEWSLVEALARRHGHASAEIALSGSGLLELYRALAEIESCEAAAGSPAEVDALARAGDPLASRTFEVFSGWLGAFAGDLALTAGARGGVYLAGGVPPRLGGLLDRAALRERFCGKGRFRPYLEAIPVRLVTHPEIALLGCRELAAGTVTAG